MTAKRISPRFLLSALAVLFILGPALPLAAANAPRTKVVLARNPRAINERNVCDLKETIRLFDRALAELTGAGTPAASWKALGLVPADVVAVKVNCNNWTIALSPQPQLIEALCRSLQAVVPANQIIVYDNDAASMKESGFALNRSAKGVRFMGTDGEDGFDVVENLTRIATRSATKIINLASLKCVDDKDMVASLLLKNHIGSLLPQDMPKCHADPDFLAGVCARPSIRDKTVLNIIAGLRGSYKRGVPWYWAGLIMGRDPVAAETAAIGVMNEKRKQEGLPALPLPNYLGIAAAKYRLGTCDAARIELIKKEI